MEEAVEQKIFCPLCLKRFKKKHEMQQDEGKMYWRCPSCWTELWPDESKLKELRQEIKSRKLAEQIREASKRSLYPDPLPLVPIVDKNSRSSSKSGRSRKKPVKKKKLWELV